MSRPTLCEIHRLRRRCPACEMTRVPNGSFPSLTVPLGTAEWLREAAKVFVGFGWDDPVAFVEWVCVDLREVAA